MPFWLAFSVPQSSEQYIGLGKEYNDQGSNSLNDAIGNKLQVSLACATTGAIISLLLRTLSI